MEQVKKKPAKHSRKREIILEGALSQISRFGLEATGLKEIAASLGMTHPALYYYFDSKDQLVFEAVRKAMNGLLEELRTSQNGLPDNPELQLLTLCEAHIVHELARGQEVSFVNAFIYGPLQNASSLSDDDRQEIRDLQRQVLTLYRERIESGQQEGIFLDSDTTQLAFGVLGLVSYTVSWFRPDGRLSISAAARSMSTQALRSIRV